MKNALTIISWAVLHQKEFDLDDHTQITKAFETLIQTEHGRIIIAWLVLQFNPCIPSFSPENTSEMNAFLDGQKSVISEIINRLLLADKDVIIKTLAPIVEEEEQDVRTIQQ